MDRRQFMAAGITASAGAAHAAPQLAVEGGSPVRKTPLRGGYWGPSHYDSKETSELVDVVEKRRPFRWGLGPNPPMKVLTFEKEFAQRMGTKYALAVTSGTAALEAAYTALGIGPGD